MKRCITLGQFWFLTGMIGIAPWLLHCAAQKPVAQEDAAHIKPLPSSEKLDDLVSGCERYLAWIQGDVQTNYKPDRQIAEAHLADWDGKVPEMTDPKYLEYVSILDATTRSAEAETLLKKFLGKNPGDSKALFLLGVHYMRAHKKDLAAYFFSTLEKDPSFTWKSLLLNNLAMLALMDKNRASAVNYLEQAVKASPPTAAPFVNLGAIYLQSGSYADAEKLFARAEEIDGEFEDAALGRGGALEGQGKFDEAHKVYAGFIDAHPDALSVLYNDSIILGNRLKQREAAAQEMLRYIQRGGKETAKAHDIIQSWR